MDGTAECRFYNLVYDLATEDLGMYEDRLVRLLVDAINKRQVVGGVKSD